VTSHRSGTGTPLVLIHGFMETWRVWEPILPALRRRHEVLAVTMPGHAGGPQLVEKITDRSLAEAVEEEMRAAGFDRAHVVGSSLGGHVALQLAARGRALSAVALAPAGGWSGGFAAEQLFGLQLGLVHQARRAAPHADALLATPEARRRATQLVTENFEHLPQQLLVQQLLGIAGCRGAEQLLEFASGREWQLEAEKIACPVRIIWGTEDRLLPWPDAAARHRNEWLPQADWIILDGVGHYPHWDVPLETAQLILGFTS
jgi:pimeloyl-ACP methyl ester carboxylesterase